MTRAVIPVGEQRVREIIREEARLVIATVGGDVPRLLRKYELLLIEFALSPDSILAVIAEDAMAAANAEADAAHRAGDPDGLTFMERAKRGYPQPEQP